MRNLFFWVEEYLFYPKKSSQKILSFILLPFTFIYCFIVISKRFLSKPKEFGLPIISIGNLTVGGSGKTPFTISLAKRYKDSAIILRGYKRVSKEMLIVEDKTDVKECADEAKLYKNSLPNSLVIVSKNRKKAIEFAKKNGAKVIFLDDAFHKANIKKFDILLKASNEPTNNFCLPSGGYREPKSFYKKADIVAIEDRDFTREVTIKHPTRKMLLVTGIAKPKRLDKFLPKDGSIVAKEYFKDHYFFTKDELKRLIDRYNATSLLVTTKDFVKIKDFNLPTSIMELEIKIDKKIIDKVDNFIDNFANIG